MKKTAAAVATALLLLAAATAAAEELDYGYYVVKQGDFLSKIGAVHGVSWQAIWKANQIENPNYIYAGQELKIPPSEYFYWIFLNRDPYSDRCPKEAIKKFKGLSDQEKELVIRTISQQKPGSNLLQHEDVLDEMNTGKSGVKQNVLVFPGTGVFIPVEDWEVEAGKYIIYLVKPIVCNNWAYIRYKKEEVFVPPPPAPPAVEEPPPPVVFPPTAPTVAAPEYARDTILDWYAGGGIYESLRDDHFGGYVWTKARVKPLWFQLTQNLRLGAGVYGFFGYGKGRDEGYNYDWNKFSFGPTVKLIGREWDTDLDIGFGQQRNYGGIDRYYSEQLDNILSVSAHLNLYSRQAKGKQWWPKTEFNFEFTMPFNQYHRHRSNRVPLAPNPHDNKSIELTTLIHIYDFSLTKDGGLKLTPGVKLGLGREFGQDTNFFLAGPLVTLSHHGNDIVQLFLFNWKENLDSSADQIQWVGITVNPYGVYRSVRGIGIKEIPVEQAL